MEFPFIINWTSPFSILGLLGTFNFTQIFDRTFCKQNSEGSDHMSHNLSSDLGLHCSYVP